ncbi:MAG TPA: hypothetical protein VEK12_19845 [Alphaproteobacteria bacterium]|nr:hypothetical protein [Alphaproteobacteria bacterium]
MPRSSRPSPERAGHAGDDDHGRADHNERQAGDVAEAAARHRDARERVRRDLEKELEFLDEKAECHDGNGRAHSSAEGALVRRVIAEALDHRATASRAMPQAHCIMSLSRFGARSTD